MGQNAVGLLLLFISHNTFAQNRSVQVYELASPISLNCKEVSGFEGISKTGCAVVTSRTPIYTFGFVVQDKNCMICRAGGTQADPTVHEIIANGPLHVDECLGRVRVGGYGCYDIMEDIGKTTWHEANEHCARMGKTLLAIESEEENNAIKNFLLENEDQYGFVTSGSHYNLGSSVWLGATDEATEGTYLWQPSGTSMTFNDWDDKQPNNKRDQNCVVYFHRNRKWHDIPCDLDIDMFICEG